MPTFQKGHQKIAGRSRGTPNRATANAREAIARFVDGNADRLQGWLDSIAQEDGPKAAFDCFLSLIEYHVPKLTRSELRAVPAYDGPPVVVNDPLEASDAYARIMRGELPATAVVFESPPTPPTAEPPAEVGFNGSSVGQAQPAEDARVAPKDANAEIAHIWGNL